ncbi:MAG TPA: 50S ribosomal protein L23 [Patescibacteria group bacterium]|nr:50S ribosomal protein L23 [Patescibacteria group bacterium]
MAIFGKKEEEKQQTAATQPVLSGQAPAVLLQPRISEKASHLAGGNKYVFKIRSQANKVEVKKAVEAAYKVRVTGVNIINTQGKRRNFGRTQGRTSAFKKAVVSLKPGDKIEGLTETI